MISKNNQEKIILNVEVFLIRLKKIIEIGIERNVTVTVQIR